MTAMGHENEAITTLPVIEERTDRLQRQNTSNAPARLAPSNVTTIERTFLSSELRLPRLDINLFRGEVIK